MACLFGSRCVIVIQDLGVKVQSVCVASWESVCQHAHVALQSADGMHAYLQRRCISEMMI